MKAMRVYLVFWLSGLIAGVILVERWRRNGDLAVVVEPGTPQTLDSSPSQAGSSAPAKKPNLVGLVVSGAKIDAERVRQRVTSAKGSTAQATGTSTSSTAE
jgi:hypothetical protein